MPLPFNPSHFLPPSPGCGPASSAPLGLSPGSKALRASPEGVLPSPTAPTLPHLPLMPASHGPEYKPPSPTPCPPWAPHPYPLHKTTHYCEPTLPSFSSTRSSQPGLCGRQVTLEIGCRLFLRSIISPERVRQACPSEELVGPRGAEEPSETPHCRSPAGGSPARPSHWASGVWTQEESWCLESWVQFYSKGAH